MLELFLLVLGFIPLIFGAHWMVTGSASLAQRFRIPPLIIGMTIVAFGTSAPELLISIFASINESGPLILGGLVGASVFNILLILGVSAIVAPVLIKASTTWIEIPLLILSSVLVMVLINDHSLAGLEFSEISRGDGIVLLLFFGIFLTYAYHRSKQRRASDVVKVKAISLSQSIFYTILGLTALAVGGKLIADNAGLLAAGFQIPERLIGFIVLPLGTSLPELVTVLIATRRKNADLAVGNLIGSSIFNLLFVLGISAVIAPIPLEPGANLDLIIGIATPSLLFLFLFTGKGRQVSRWEGAIMVAGYISYLTYLLLSSPLLKII